MGKYRAMKSPTKRKDGSVFATAADQAEEWAKFAEAKFRATEREAERDDLPDLGPAKDREWGPSDEDMEVCLKALSLSKAAGWDELTAEMFKSSYQEAKDQLFTLVRQCWMEEDVPAEMVKGVFVPLFKNKGSQDDGNETNECVCVGGRNKM